MGAIQGRVKAGCTSLQPPGKREQAQRELEKLAYVNSLDNWRFTEWFHCKTLEPMGMAGQSWNAASFLMAKRVVAGTARPEPPPMPLVASA